MQRVYLAGGMKTKWRQYVKTCLAEKGVDWMDPCSHGIVDPAGYTDWDLWAITESDCLLGFLEKSNPAGANLTLEIGYAKARGLHVVFVDETERKDMTMAREVADELFSNLDDAIAYLRDRLWEPI
jgi:hypothetical protein